MKHHLPLSRFRSLSAAALAVALMLSSASNADNTTSISFIKDGGSQVVSFPYTGSYSGPSHSEDWLTTGTQVKMSNGSGTLNITISCEANQGAARSGYIEFYLSGSPYTIYVSQAGADDDRDSDDDDDPPPFPMPDLAFVKPIEWTAPVTLSSIENSTEHMSSFTTKQTVHVNYCYWNKGNENATNNKLSVRVYDSSGALVNGVGFDVNVTSLDPEYSKRRTSDNDIGGTLPPGTYSVEVFLDYENVIPESDESNNSYRVAFTVISDDPPSDDPISFGVGKVSTFTVPNAGTAVLVGASGVTWSNFSGTDSYGATTFVNENIVDCEKTAADDDDDLWCYPMSDMNALFFTGWSQKTSYATVDAMKGHFNGNLIRQEVSGKPVEGTYGFNNNGTWGDFFDWYRNETGVDLAANGALTEGTVGATFPATLRSLMADGSHVVRVNVLFDNVLYNRRWKDKGFAMLHGVLCVGYVSSGDTLNALLIVDPDNDQYTGAGGVNAPNSVMYCPVSWNGSAYTINGIWGQEGSIKANSKYRAIAKKEEGNPTYKIAFNANGGKAKKKMNALSMTYGASKKLTKNTYTRQGYIFIGWAVSKANAKKGVVAYKNKASVANLTTNGGTVTLYAVWAKKNYKVKFYANGGKGKMDVESMTYGKAKKLTANKFTRKGYKFAGWAKTKSDAKNGLVVYKNKKKVKNLITTGKTVKLYAVWEKREEAILLLF